MTAAVRYGPCSAHLWPPFLCTKPGHETGLAVFVAVLLLGRHQKRFQYPAYLGAQGVLTNIAIPVGTLRHLYLSKEADLITVWPLVLVLRYVFLLARRGIGARSTGARKPNIPAMEPGWPWPHMVIFNLS